MLELFKKPSFPWPDIILSDLNMPGRNGYEVIIDIKTNSSLSHIPIIILTTASSVPFAVRCKKLGACAYFTKPDTFLEYKEFAEKIYGDVRECLSKDKLDYSDTEKLKKSVHNVWKAYLSMVSFFNDWIKIMLYSTEQQ